MKDPLFRYKKNIEIDNYKVTLECRKLRKELVKKEETIRKLKKKLALGIKVF